MEIMTITKNKFTHFFALFGLILLFGLAACSSGDGGVIEEETAVPLPTTSAATEEPETTAVIDPTDTPEIVEDDPTAVPTAAPTATPVPEIVTFVLEDAEKTLPTDLYQQVSYFGMFDFFFEGIYCGDLAFETADIALEFNLRAYHALSDEPASTPTLYDSIEMRSCDWQAGDEVSIRLTMPSGETIEKEIVYGIPDLPVPRAERVNELVYFEDDFDFGELALYFVPGFNNETGEYSLKIEGNDRSLTGSFTVTVPSQPRVFDEGNIDSSAWLLSNFVPGEHVRLVAYGNFECNDEAMYEVDPSYVSLCLQGWQTYTVPETGRLAIQVEPTEMFIYYALVGEESGTFALNAVVNSEVVQADAQVRADWVPRLYENNKDSTSAIRLSPGTPVRIMGQYQGLAWVQLPDESRGWLSLGAIDDGETAVSIPSNIIYQSDGTDLPEWAYLPTAPYFYMGSDSYSAQFSEPAEQPAHFVSLTSFWMQRTEVSNAAYAECVTAGVCTEPTSLASATRAEYYANPEFAGYPVIFVTQPQANVYCQWTGGRLPTEAEWEYAARYPTNTYYTWGNDPTQAADNPELANFDKIAGDTVSVFSAVNGATESGLLNIHGNVWEWTADWFDENYYEVSPENNPSGPETGSQKVARGGSWSTDLEFISLTNRFNRDPNQGYDNTGFRCVRVTSP